MFKYIKNHFLGFSGFLILTFIFIFLTIICIGSDVFALTPEESQYYMNNRLPEENCIEIYNNALDFLDGLTLNNMPSQPTIYHYLIFRNQPSFFDVILFHNDEDFYSNIFNDLNNIRFYNYVWLRCNLDGDNFEYISSSLGTGNNATNFNEFSQCYSEVSSGNNTFKDYYIDFDIVNRNNNFFIESKPLNLNFIPPVENIENLDNLNMQRFLYCEFYLQETLHYDYYDYLIYHGVREFGNENHDFIVFFINENHNTYVDFLNSTIQYQYIWSNYYITFVYNNTYDGQFVFDEYSIHDTDEVSTLWGSLRTQSGGIYYYSSFSLMNKYNDAYYFEENPITTNYFYSYKDYFGESDYYYGEIWSRPISKDYFNSIGARIKINDNWVDMPKENPFDTGDNYFIFYYSEINMNDSYQCQLYDLSTGNSLSNEYVDVNSLLFNVILSRYTDDEEPLLAYTGDFPDDDSNAYDSYSWKVYYRSTKDFQIHQFIDMENMIYDEWEEERWTELPKEDFNDPDYILRHSRYWTRIIENGTYYFKFVRDNLISPDEEYFVKVDITNIVDGTTLFYDNLPKPIITLDFDEESQSYVLRTQNILWEKAMELYCLVTDDLNNFDFDSWNKFEIDWEEDPLMHTSYAYFTYKIPVINAVDKDYHIVFKNFLNDTFSEDIFYQFRVDYASDYVQNHLGQSNNLSFIFNDFQLFLRERFGILFYPVDFIVKFLQRIHSLNYLDPIIRIPELKEPFFNYTIFEGTEFNFNTLLENPTFSYLYAIYLVAVDVVFIMAFIGFLYKCYLDLFKD
ncbi:MAG: hypothetical protein J6M60_03560 [Clostridia bacterium]|nr:hypothetical protein [Clostridia bacterium]